MTIPHHNFQTQLDVLTVDRPITLRNTHTLFHFSYALKNRLNISERSMKILVHLRWLRPLNCCVLINAELRSCATTLSKSFILIPEDKSNLKFYE